MHRRDLGINDRICEECNKNKRNVLPLINWGKLFNIALPEDVDITKHVCRACVNKILNR